MKIRYCAETDGLYIGLPPDPGTDVTVVNDDVHSDLNAAGRAVAIDIDNASEYYDVNNLETVGMSAVRLASAQPANA